MRGSTALLIAGMAAIVTGAAPVLAAEEPAPLAPAPAAESSSAVTPTEEPAPASVATDEPEADEDGGGLERPSLDSALEEREDDRRREAKAAARRDDEPKRPLADASVTMKDIEFKPRTLSISPGDRVTWTNRDTAQHNAVDDGEFRTPLLEKGERASVTIDDPGTYDYICTVHPDMKAKLVAGSGGSRGSSGSSGSGGTSGSGSSGGTSTSPGSSAGTFPSPSSGSASGGGSSGSLPNTGQEQLPLLILGAGLIVSGLLARAFHEYWIWR